MPLSNSGSGYDVGSVRGPGWIGILQFGERIIQRHDTPGGEWGDHSDLLADRWMRKRDLHADDHNHRYHFSYHHLSG